MQSETIKEITRWKAENARLKYKLRERKAANETLRKKLESANESNEQLREDVDPLREALKTERIRVASLKSEQREIAEEFKRLGHPLAPGEDAIQKLRNRQAIINAQAELLEAADKVQTLYEEQKRIVDEYLERKTAENEG